MREKIKLESTAGTGHFYTTTKNKRTTPDKIEIKKFDPRVRKHVLGTPVAGDPLVYEEHDDSFYMGLDRSRDDRFICIGVESTVSSELRCAPAADPREFRVLAPRTRDVEYQADHLGDRWVIRTNDAGASNFKLVTAPTDARLKSMTRTRTPAPSSLVTITLAGLMSRCTTLREWL